MHRKILYLFYKVIINLVENYNIYEIIEFKGFLCKSNLAYIVSYFG